MSKLDEAIRNLEAAAEELKSAPKKSKRQRSFEAETLRDDALMEVIEIFMIMISGVALVAIVALIAWLIVAAGGGMALLVIVGLAAVFLPLFIIMMD